MPSTISAGTTAGTAIAIAGDTTGNLAFQTNGTTTAMTIDTSQNVGIGTTSPTSKLDVSGEIKTLNDTAATGVIIKRTSGVNANGAVNFVGSDDTVDASVRMATDVANALVFTAGGTTERMRIDSSGNLLIGKTSASGTTQGIFLQSDGVYGFTRNETGTGPLGYFINANGTVTSGYRFASFRVTSGFTEVGTITTNGTSTTSYNTSSDYRLKENIAPMIGALAKVAQLKPVTYKWKSDGSDGQGFIAHELQAVVPDCVTGEKDAVELVDIKDEEGNVIGQEEKPVYQGVDTSFLVATLTAAIQELKAELDATKAEVAALKGVA